MAVGQLDYLAFTLGQYFRYSGHPGFNKEFEGLITEGRQSLVGQEFLGVEQRGVIYSREEVAGWGTTQEGIFDGFDFPTILILDRPTAGF